MWAKSGPSSGAQDTLFSLIKKITADCNEE